jgi:L-ascorbate metabolism protein UlaG (beta-lactamase superfamily)
MRITHLGHSCVLLEMADARLLIDPGTFAEDLSEVRELDAVLVTHQHPDHLDPERVPGLLAANPGARVLADPGSVEVLTGLGLEAHAHDGPTTVGSVTVTPVGEVHALIHDEIPRIPNVGVRLDADGEPSFFHPGDALDAEPGDVDVLAFPLQAPWQRSREMTAFLRRLAPRHAVPIHDGLLQPRGRALYLGQAGQLGSPDTEIRDLAGQGAVEIGAGE